MELAKLVSAYRREQKLSVRQLARKIGVDHTTLFRFMNGQQSDGETLTKILSWAFQDYIKTN